MSNLAAIHAKRVTLQVRDMYLVQSIRKGLLGYSLPGEMSVDRIGSFQGLGVKPKKTRIQHAIQIPKTTEELAEAERLAAAAATATDAEENAGDEDAAAALQQVYSSQQQYVVRE